MAITNANHPLVSSGTTAVATVADAAVTCITATVLGTERSHAQIANTGAVAGFYSVDGGTTWAYLPASTVLTLDDVDISGAIQVKRVAGGADLSGVYAAAW